MAAVKPLGNLLAEKRLTEDELMKKVEAEHLPEIAHDLYGAEWELLAPHIGVSDADVHDIKEKESDPEVRRSIFLKKWRERRGSDATYLNLIKGLERRQNRQLTEKVLQLFMTSKENGTLCIKIEEVAVNGNCCSYLKLAVVVLISFVLSATITRVGNYHTGDVGHTTRDQQTTAISLRLNQWMKETNLPVWNATFVNREYDINEIVRRVLEYNIVNINGAPGFGKSALANRVGFRLLEQNILVRYLDMDDEFTKKYTGEYHQKSIQDISTFEATHGDVNFVHTKQEDAGFNKYQQTFEDVYSWSMLLSERAVLILDNCDRYLASSLRDSLLGYIDSLVHSSQNQLHIIIVSQEKLLLVDSFDHWTVKELDRNASVELLKLMAPDVSNKLLVEVADMLQGCPLALRVVGKMLHLHRNDSPYFYYQLQKALKMNPLNVINKASEHKYRFSTVMNLAFSLFEDLRNCGYSLGLFPGSFSWQAGMVVLGNECFDIYLTYSLIDEKNVANISRYTVHRLIKVYLNETLKKKTDAKSAILLFRNKFVEFYTYLLVGSDSSEINDSIELSSWLFYEDHNIEYFWKLLYSIQIDSDSQREATLIAGRYPVDYVTTYLVLHGYQKMNHPHPQECFDFTIFLKPNYTQLACEFNESCLGFVSNTLNQCFEHCRSGKVLKEILLPKLCNMVKMLIESYNHMARNYEDDIYFRNITSMMICQCSNSTSFGVDLKTPALQVVFIIILLMFVIAYMH